MMKKKPQLEVVSCATIQLWLATTLLGVGISAMHGQKSIKNQWFYNFMRVVVIKYG